MTTSIPNRAVTLYHGRASIGLASQAGLAEVILEWLPSPRYVARIEVDLDEDAEQWPEGLELDVDLLDSHLEPFRVRVESSYAQSLLFPGTRVYGRARIVDEELRPVRPPEWVDRLRMTFTNVLLPLPDDAEILVDDFTRLGGPNFQFRGMSASVLIDDTELVFERLDPWQLLEIHAIVEHEREGVEQAPSLVESIWRQSSPGVFGHAASLAVEVRSGGTPMSRSEALRWIPIIERFVSLATATSSRCYRLDVLEPGGNEWRTEWRTPTQAPSRNLDSWWPRRGADASQVRSALIAIREITEDEYSRRWFDLALQWYAAAVDTHDSRSRLILTQSAMELAAWVHLVAERGMSTDGFERMRAADKIRLLLQASGVSIDVPRELNMLQGFERDGRLADAVLHVVEARNRAVHPPRRLESTGADEASVRQAAELALAQLEGVLRARVGWDGSYWDRTRLVDVIASA